MTRSKNYETGLHFSDSHFGFQNKEDMLNPERFFSDLNGNDSISELFRTIASMGINNVDASRKDGSINRDDITTPPAPPPSPASAHPPLMTTREMDVDDYITFYTYGSQNLASRCVQSTPSRLEIPDNLRPDNLKQISDIIQSKEVKKELSEKGEIISHLFEKQLLAKLEASGLISEDAVDTAKTTAIKFAKWVEEILSECEKRKRVRKLKENKSEFDVATFDGKKYDPMQDDSTAVRTETELVRINEISDDEIEKRFGGSLKDSSKHVLFHFESPDRQPRIVVHLLSDSNVKEMIVREMTSDMNWSNWLIEIGSQDSSAIYKNLASSIGMRLEDRSKSSSEETKFVEGKAKEAPKHSTFEWDANAMANIFGNKNIYGKIPILKRQCVSTTNDSGVEYPIYLPKLSGSIRDKLFDFEGTEVIFPMPPQHDYSET
ncbi:hypothetical protein LSTR_LSTR004573 [Laodelphax striatellus]|uniref:Uncharacterized protein n=1 Tax=Laodelphax striatellus TaxID=195883 RepID=A0A482WTF1_LAOST|nr:hypothetical protein LSTR_LSTR004573 [Laodelphax striatellus]